MKPTSIARPRIPVIACPHCDSRAIVRNSEQMAPLCRELRFRCENDACGHTFVASLEIIRTITPSACPNPNVHLPLAPRRAAPRPANDDVVANDNRLRGDGAAATNGPGGTSVANDNDNAMSGTG